MLTFVHLSNLEELEKHCREQLGITDIVRYREHFKALEDRLSVGQGRKEMGKMPTVALSGTFTPQQKEKYLALKKKFAVPHRRVMAEFLGIRDE